MWMLINILGNWHPKPKWAAHFGVWLLLHLFTDQKIYKFIFFLYLILAQLLLVVVQSEIGLSLFVDWVFLKGIIVVEWVVGILDILLEFLRIHHYFRFSPRVSHHLTILNFTSLPFLIFGISQSFHQDWVVSLYFFGNRASLAFLNIFFFLVEKLIHWFQNSWVWLIFTCLGVIWLVVSEHFVRHACKSRTCLVWLLDIFIEAGQAGQPGIPRVKTHASPALLVIAILYWIKHDWAPQRWFLFDHLQVFDTA